MPSDTHSFWGLDFEEESLEETPRQVLIQQAELLGDITDDFLRGVVITRKDPNNSEYLLHDLFVIAPRLDAYRYRILWISQPITIYPLQVRSSLLEEEVFECNDIDNFKEIIMRILSSEKSRRVIKSLYLQSRDNM